MDNVNTIKNLKNQTDNRVKILDFASKFDLYGNNISINEAQNSLSIL